MNETLLWVIFGAIAAVLVIVVVVGVISFRTMRRLTASVDASWEALARALTARNAAAAPLVEAAPAEQRGAAESALAAVDAATEPRAKAAAEARAQEALRPLIAGASTASPGSAAHSARAELAELDDQVQQRRREFNTETRELSARSRRFPTSLFASRAGAGRDFFEIDHAGAKAEPPKVQF